MKDIDIRRWEPGEEAAIWNVVYTATRESNARDYHPDLIERWAPADKDMDEWRERLVGTRPFVALEGGEIVGMAEIEAGGFIDYFYVHPRAQGRGVGSALMERIESEAAALGVSELSAMVSVTAKPFFSSRGFEVIEARNNLVLGLPAPNFEMRKRLGTSS